MQTTLIVRRAGKLPKSIVAKLMLVDNTPTVVKYGTLVEDRPYRHIIFIGCFDESVAIMGDLLTAFVDDAQDCRRVLDVFPRTRVVFMSLRVLTECFSFADYFRVLSERDRVATTTEAVAHLSIAEGPVPRQDPAPEQAPAPVPERPQGPYALPPYPPAKIGSTSVVMEKGAWGLDAEVVRLAQTSGREVAIMWRPLPQGGFEVHAYSPNLNCMDVFRQFLGPASQAQPRQVKFVMSSDPRSLVVEV